MLAVICRWGCLPHHFPSIVVGRAWALGPKRLFIQQIFTKCQIQVQIPVPLIISGVTLRKSLSNTESQFLPSVNWSNKIYCLVWLRGNEIAQEST